MRNMLSKALTTMAMAGAVIFAASPAHAADLTWEVVEVGVVPDVTTDIGPIFVNSLAGNYTEIVAFDGLGNFYVTAILDLSSYALGGSDVSTFLNDTPNFPPTAESYNMYALFYATGTICGSNLCGSSATASIYVDPDFDTLYDGANNDAEYRQGEILDVLNATTPGQNPFPQFTDDEDGDDELVASATDLIQGVGDPTFPPSFDFRWLLNPSTDFTSFGLDYWPTFNDVELIFAVVDGDFDEIDFSGLQTVTGEADIRFRIISPVPEPATLTLLGLGLVGAAVVGRRRRKTQA